jgi:peptide/nickel transport system substrate-binding protein
MKMSRISGWIALLAFALAACGGDEKTSTSRLDQNTIIYHWRAEPDNLHPTNGVSVPRRVIMDFTQGFLVAVDPDSLKLAPALVKTMPEISADGLEFTYELRDEPTWDNGERLSVNDVIFSIKAFKCPLTDDAQVRPYFDMIKDVRIDSVNNRKFTVVVTSKYIQNVALFADLPIMQESYHDKNQTLRKYSFEQFSDTAFTAATYPDVKTWADVFNDNKFGRDPKFMNGLGPYKLSSWDAKQQLTIEKKPSHWMEKLQNKRVWENAYPDKIVFKIITDDNAVALELKKQEIDASHYLASGTLLDLQKDEAFNKNYHSAFFDNFNYQYIGMNLKPQEAGRTPLFTDVRVRKAMALLAPIDAANKAYMFGKANRLASCVVPTKKSVYNNDLALVPFDPEQAKQLLDEAGWKDTDGDNIRDKVINGRKVQFEFEFLAMSGAGVQEYVVKDYVAELYKAGVKANIRSLEFVTFYETVQKHEFDMYFGGWGGTFFYEDYKQVWHSSSWNGGNNYVGYGTAASDALIDSIRVTLDDNQRIAMEKRLQKMIYDDQPYVFVFTNPFKGAIHRRFENATFYPERPNIYLGNLKLIPGWSTMKPAAE